MPFTPLEGPLVGAWRWSGRAVRPEACRHDQDDLAWVEWTTANAVVRSERGARFVACDATRVCLDSTAPVPRRCRRLCRAGSTTFRCANPTQKTPSLEKVAPNDGRSLSHAWWCAQPTQLTRCAGVAKRMLPRSCWFF